MSTNKDEAIRIICEEQKGKEANQLQLASCYLLVEICDLLEDVRRQIAITAKTTAYHPR